MADGSVNGIIRQRLQVAHADLDPGSYPGALYFGEASMVHPGDAQNLNHNNNASYRRLNISEPPFLTATIADSTAVSLPAIQGWQDMDPLVQMTQIDVPDEGRFLLYYKASDNMNGTWHFEYALYNVNSDRSARRFAIPVPAGVAVTNLGFHDIDYHSGDGIDGANFDGTDWPTSLTGTVLEWSTDTFDDNPNANALRFGTTYNFRFDADSPAVEISATLGLFKAGGPDALAFNTVGPMALSCAQDLNADGLVDVSDLLDLLANWGACAPQSDCDADLDDDAVVSVTDLLELLAAWGPC